MQVDSRVADATVNGSAVHNPTVDKDGLTNGTPPNGHGVTVAPIHTADENAPRDSIQSGSSGSHSTSMSSLTVSTAPRTSMTDGAAYGADFPTNFSPAAMAIASPSVESPKPNIVPSSPKAKEEESQLERTLSFRTDSTGSMGSLVSNLNLSEGAAETGSSTPDSSYETPKKRNQNQNSVSSASILISALKNRRAVVHKKSVSFSLPSEDDIARKAQKMNSALLYDGLEEFDNNMLDYQISSPKSSLSGKPRAYTSPVRATKPAAARVTGIAALQLSTESTKTEPSAGETSAPAVEASKLPPHPGVPALGRKTSLRDRPEARAQNLPVPPSGENLPDLPRAMTAHAGTQPTLKLTDVSTPSSSSSAASHEAQTHVAPPPPPPPPAAPTLMQRITEASTAEELCRVFDITSESVFTGEIMTKRFSRDIIAKDRFVWIVPRTKSIHWAKDAKDRLDNHKVKYFLLDKNSPHINTMEMLSTASSCKDDPARRGRPPLPSTPSPERTTTGSFFDRAELLNASGGASGSGDEAGFGAPDEEPGTEPAAAEFEEAKASSSYAIPERASGELVGIIHSAVISHLSIKIKTESGDYLSLTIKSNATAVQRAKDWFSVIKTLTKDVSLSAQDTIN